MGRHFGSRGHWPGRHVCLHHVIVTSLPAVKCNSLLAPVVFLKGPFLCVSSIYIIVSTVNTLVYILTTLQFPSALSKTRTVAACVIIIIRERFMQNLYLCILLHAQFQAPLLFSLLITFKIYVCLRGLLGRKVGYYQHWIRRLVSQDLFLP